MNLKEATRSAVLDRVVKGEMTAADRKQERPVYDDPDLLEAYDDDFIGSIYGVRVS